MIIVFTGTREGRPDFDDVADVELADLLAAGVPREEIRVRHGNQRGVDKQADAWARRNELPVDPVDAPWDDDVLHDQAGSVRNDLMLTDCGPPDLCVGLPGPRSSGTWDCVKRARRRKMKVQVHPPRPFTLLRFVRGGE